MADATLAAEFFTRFRSEVQSLSQRIADASTSAAKKDAAREDLKTRISKLRKELVEATPYLPSYDQRQSEIQMKRLEQQLDTFLLGSSGGMSGGAKSGTRFAFKRPAKATDSSIGGQGASYGITLATKSAAGVSDERISQGAQDATQGQQEKPIASVKESQPSASTTLRESLDFHNRSREYITCPSRPALEGDNAATNQLSTGTEVSLSSLSDCIIDLSAAPIEIGTIRAFHARDLKRCIVVMPYVEGGALMHDCEDCIIAVGCHQFRIHTSNRTDVYLYVNSTPILEKCSAMRFAPYRLSQDALPPDALGKENQYDQVQDFLWLRSAHSPNWSLIPSNEQLLDDWKQLIGKAEDIDATLNRILPKDANLATTISS